MLLQPLAMYLGNTYSSHILIEYQITLYTLNAQGAASLNFKWPNIHVRHHTWQQRHHSQDQVGVLLP